MPAVVAVGDEPLDVDGEPATVVQLVRFDDVE